MFSTKIAFPGGYHGYIHAHGYNVCFITSGIVLVKRHTDAEFCPIDNCNVGMTDFKLYDGDSLLDRGWDAPR
jgi:hypothetical protein